MNKLPDFVKGILFNCLVVLIFAICIFTMYFAQLYFGITGLLIVVIIIFIVFLGIAYWILK